MRDQRTGTTEEISRLGRVVAEFVERADRYSLDENESRLSELLREMIAFRGEEVMHWKDSIDLRYWKMLNELIREVHAATDAAVANLAFPAVKSAVVAASLPSDSGS